MTVTAFLPIDRLSAQAAGGLERRARPRAISIWLLSVAALVFFMVVVGGITRITDSGLSITRWDLFTGALPPLTQSAWEEAFRLYRETEEFRQVNAAMTLDGFKFIFFWEYAHRLLGRFIGLAYGLPLLVFWLRGAIPSGYRLRLLALLALGAFQGAIGWWMVQSGLWQAVDVSHYRLAVHLVTALTIMGGLIWTALDVRRLHRLPAARAVRPTLLGWAAFAGLFLQLLMGAWTAGLKAGYVATGWPLMNGHFVPEGIQWAGGVFVAAANDPFLVHFLHRWWAWGVAVLLVALAHRLVRAERKGPARAIGVVLTVQILLGIATVMSGIDPVYAILHQAVGALVVAATVWGVHGLGGAQPKAASLAA